MRKKRESFDNSLTGLVEAISTGNRMTGGSFLSSYDTIAHSNNYSLITLNRVILTYFYTTCGMFQTAIQLPIEDALSKGINIDSKELDPEDIDEIFEFWEEHDIINKVIDAFTWVRLYGGGGLLINTNQDPKNPLNIKTLKNSPLDFYDVDRWEINYNDTTETYTFHGDAIHESRFLIGRGKRAPAMVRSQLRGWGMSEGERMIRDLNLFLKTQDVTYELIDEAKVDVYKIKDFASKLMQRGGTEKVSARVQKANQLKSYINALVLDMEEDYQQKTMQFNGLADIMKENRIGVASALRMPMTKLFGISASGFNAGEDDLEQYNQMVESEVRAKLLPWFRKIVKITCQHLFGYEPSFKLSFPPMRVLTEIEEQQVKDSELNRLNSMYDRGIINSKEYAEMADKAGIVTIETEANQGLIDKFPEQPGENESVSY